MGRIWICRRNGLPHCVESYTKRKHKPRNRTVQKVAEKTDARFLFFFAPFPGGQICQRPNENGENAATTIICPESGVERLSSVWTKKFVQSPCLEFHQQNG